MLESISTHEFGAAVDGMSDDTAAVQAAIDRAAARGRVLQVSPGAHLIREVRLRRGLKGLIGPGTLRGIDPTPEAVVTSDGPFFGGRAPENFVISDLEIDCNAQSGGARRALFLTGIRNARLQKLRIRNLPPAPPHGGEAIRLMWSCRDIEIRECRLELPRGGDMLGIYVLGRRDGDFWDEPVREDTTDGYFFPLRETDHARIHGRRLVIETGKFRRGDRKARVYLIIPGVPDFATTVARVISPNEVLLARAAPESGRGVTGWIQPGKIRYTSSGACRDILIADNEISGGRYGIGLERVDRARIIRNHLDGQIRNISVGTGSRHVEVEANECLNADSTGIHLAYGIRHSCVRGNRIRSAVTTWGDNAAINHYVDGYDNEFILNEIEGEFRFGVYLGAGIRKCRIALNQIDGVDVGVAVESDWISGMRGSTFGRSNSVSYITAVRDTEDLEIRGNTIAARSVALYLSQVTNAWGRPYRNRDHVIEENDVIDPRSEAIHIFEIEPSTIEDIRLLGLETASRQAFQLPRGRAHFKRIRNVPGLEEK